MMGLGQSNLELTANPKKWARSDYAALGFALLLAGVVLSKDIAVGGLRFGDTAVHAMDGVLIHDWVAAGPQAWLGPMEFAERQYAHYPCLGIGRHYPPGFAIVEAAFFAVFGISAFTARLCVVFFGLIAAAGTYVFVRSFADRTVSFLAAVVLMTLPSVTLWGRQAMLEVPTLAVLSWGAVAFSWYLRRPSWGRLGVLLFVALSSLLFRQTGVFLVGALAMTLAYCVVQRRVRLSHCVCCGLVAGVAIVLVTLSFEGAGAKMMRGRATYSSLWQPAALTFYLRQLPEQVGWPVLAAAAIGFFVSKRRFGALWVFLICWFFVAYVMVTSADLKFTRFSFVGLFPIAVLAAIGAGSILALLRRAQARAVFSSIAVAGLCFVAFVQPGRHFPDLGVVAEANKDKIEGRVVLFSGHRDTHFVFAVRERIPWRKAAVVRGSKLFYTCNTVPGVGFESYVSSVGDVGELLRRFAFGQVFAQRENPFRVAEDDLLVEFLSSGSTYRRQATYPLLAAGGPTPRDTIIDVYEPAVPLFRDVDYFDIPIPRSNRTVRLDLTEWSG